MFGCPRYLIFWTTYFGENRIVARFLTWCFWNSSMMFPLKTRKFHSLVLGKICCSWYRQSSSRRSRTIFGRGNRDADMSAGWYIPCYQWQVSWIGSVEGCHIRSESVQHGNRTSLDIGKYGHFAWINVPDNYEHNGTPNLDIEDLINAIVLCIISVHPSVP